MKLKVVLFGQIVDGVRAQDCSQLLNTQSAAYSAVPSTVNLVLTPLTRLLSAHPIIQRARKPSRSEFILRNRNAKLRSSLRNSAKGDKDDSSPGAGTRARS